MVSFSPLGCGAFVRPPSLLGAQLSLFAVVAAVSAREASFRAHLLRWEATCRLGGNMPVPCRFAAAASPGYASARSMDIRAVLRTVGPLPDHRYRELSSLLIFLRPAQMALPECVCVGEAPRHSTREASACCTHDGATCNLRPAPTARSPHVLLRPNRT